MKKITHILTILILFATTAYPQNFEGTVKYDLKYSGEAIAQFASMMPSAYTLKLKGDKSRFTIEGGMMSALMGDIITHSDKELAYILMPQQKTAYKISTKDSEKNAQEKLNAPPIVPKVINTGETEKINGYNCTKYKISIKNDEGEIISYVWASKDIAAKLPKATMQTGITTYEGIDGFPVKIEQNMSQMGISFTMNIILNELKQGKIPDSEFTVPSDYKIEEGLPNLGRTGK
jgi:hypothetical protein